MHKFLNTKEIQYEEKKILDEVVNFLNKNKINYFLCGGSLLGAIRHKGFIPWDDDIDIAIPRPDYNKLQELIKKNNILSESLYFHSYELGNLNMPFTKVYNHSIEIYDWRYTDKYEKYLWVDIFPVDGMPDTDDETIKLFKKRDFWKKILSYRKMSLKCIFMNKNVFTNILKYLLKIIFLILPEKFLPKKIINLNKCNYVDSSYTGVYTWGYGPRERMKKEIFEEYILVDFEGTKYNGLKNYDKYLTNVYGDYMKLPPKEKRITHSFKAWRVDENEKENKE